MYSFVKYHKSSLSLKFCQLGRKILLYFRAVAMIELGVEKGKLRSSRPRWVGVAINLSNIQFIHPQEGLTITTVQNSVKIILYYKIRL